MTTVPTLDDALSAARGGVDGGLDHEAFHTLRERAGDLRDQVSLEDLEPAARKAQLGFWHAVRALFAGLAVLPALLFRGLRSVAGGIDEVVQRTDIEKRTERLAKRWPDRRPRVRRRTALLWAAGGVGVGAAAGWALGTRRRQLEEEIELQVGDPAVNGSATRDPALHE